MPLLPRQRGNPQKSSPKLFPHLRLRPSSHTVKDPRPTTRPTWITDVWHCLSGITLATSSPANAVAVLKRASQLKTSIGDCYIERQESWVTFIVGQIKKSTHCFDGENVSPIPVTDNMLLPEIRGVAHQAPITQCNWTRKSLDPSLEEGYAWVGVQASGAHLFPNKLRLFSRPVMVNRIKKSPKISSCNRCHGFHMERKLRAPLTLSDLQQTRPSRRMPIPNPQCCNCCGPHPSFNIECPAGPKVASGQLERIPRRQLRNIREAGKNAFSLLHQPSKQEETRETSPLTRSRSSPSASTTILSSQANQAGSPTRRSSSKQPNAHDIALSLAAEKGCDIIAIQEPWVATDLSTRLSKSHPSYIPLSSNWPKRPRVLLYIRRGRALTPVQTLTDISRDLLYPGQGLRDFLHLPIDSNPAIGPCLGLGDFNIRHADWDSTTGHRSQDGEDLLNLTLSQGLQLLNPADSPTHQKGGTLDLSFCLANATCRIAPELHSTSDHETLLYSPL
ncbi:hypothetical protein ACJ73_05213 [Blastomyces percursus]|uniref:Endonuclease/exonuclease/phosphatase domain-containing protein n=1 Tax=Blastomyces percursus TaxID=1658174 RepID=A0A1J9Q438_9EURO|nr:hypothetical protein ACJ73_05213 [Blastomyces percursus]